MNDQEQSDQAVVNSIIEKMKAVVLGDILNLLRGPQAKKALQEAVAMGEIPTGEDWAKFIEERFR